MTQPWFPNPVRQAAALLEVCEDDLDAARELAANNALGGDLKQSFDYWLDVRNALLPEKAARA